MKSTYGVIVSQAYKRLVSWMHRFMEDQQDETRAPGQPRLTVNFGQTVIPIQGILQREVVMAFTMGGHARVGRDSPVRILDSYPELLRLVCFFADIWREFHPGLVVRTHAPDDSFSFYIRSNMQLSDPRLNRLAEPLPDTETRIARYLDRFGLEILNLGEAHELTWTEPEIL